MRVAVLADIHGNLPALRAVLDEMERDPPDAIVVAGDVVGGAYPREVLELLAARPQQVVWVRGNAEREAVAAWDGAPVADDEPGQAAAWTAQALDRRWRDRLASWPIAVTLDGVCYCHGSPRADDEILTRATPDAVMGDALGGVAAAIVVGGHTQLAESLLEPVDPDWVAAFFEHAAGRGPDPGAPPGGDPDGLAAARAGFPRSSRLRFSPARTPERLPFAHSNVMLVSADPRPDRYPATMSQATRPAGPSLEPKRYPYTRAIRA
ncbi:MAG TPA: metallophosphoesterase [Solirubrobacteraceae bacterium]|nr:metallophosphoesterase [Solirubrobacteraceae bacterium]